MYLLRISSVNVANSTGMCGFGHIYWKNLYGKIKLRFFVKWKTQETEAADHECSKE